VAYPGGATGAMPPPRWPYLLDFVLKI